MQWLGAGAKTAAGYGRMEEDIWALARLQDALKQQRQALEDAVIIHVYGPKLIR